MQNQPQVNVEITPSSPPPVVFVTNTAPNQPLLGQPIYVQQRTTSMDLSPQVEVAIATLFTFLGSLIIFLIEKMNVYVIAWCIQVMLVSLIIWGIYVALWILNLILVSTLHFGYIAYLLWVMNLCQFILWIIMVVLAITKAPREEFTPFPGIGVWAMTKARERVAGYGFVPTGV